MSTIDFPTHRGRARVIALFLTAVGIASVGVAAAPAPAQAWSARTYSAASERQLVELTNAARARVGRKALRWDPALARIARTRSRDMVARRYFSHSIPPSGRSVFDVMEAKRYCFHVAGENIGWNINYPEDQATPAIQQAFLQSRSHRAVIVGRAWDVIGIGAYKGANGRMMWTVLFADRCGPLPPATPRPQPPASGAPSAAATSASPDVSPSPPTAPGAGVPSGPPEQSASPDLSAAPEPSDVPEWSAAPEPSAVPDPDGSAEPDAAAEPVASSEPPPTPSP